MFPVSSVALVNKILTYTREWVQLYTVVEAKNAEFKSVVLKAHLYAFSFPSDYVKAIGTKVTTGFQAGKEADPLSTVEQWQLGFTAFANVYYERAIELLYGSGVLSKVSNGVMNENQSQTQSLSIMGKEPRNDNLNGNAKGPNRPPLKIKYSGPPCER